MAKEREVNAILDFVLSDRAYDLPNDVVYREFETIDITDLKLSDIEEMIDVLSNISFTEKTDIFKQAMIFKACLYLQDARGRLIKRDYKSREVKQSDLFLKDED